MRTTNHLSRLFHGLILLAVIAFSACREPEVIDTEDLQFGRGLYILNEGNMGSNKASIDFYDPTADTLYRNIYPVVNPNVIKELGDVGNDLAIYGGKLYAVINVSGKIEVMDRQARRITQVDVPNCRSICFSGGYAYVSSYAGPVEINENYQQLGYVAKIDTATLTIVDTCTVGYQPNGIAASEQYLYVANSGGYMAPNYDSTLSVISLQTFEEVTKIPVAVNLNQVVYDAVRERVYVSSQGDYYQHPAALYAVSTKDYSTHLMQAALTRMQLCGNRLYGYQGMGKSWQVGYIDLDNGAFTAIPLSNQSAIQTPYCLFVDAESLYLTDARDYVTPGVLYRYSLDGQYITHQRTGDIPAHICRKD